VLQAPDRLFSGNNIAASVNGVSRKLLMTSLQVAGCGDVVARGSEAVFVCDVVHGYARSFRTQIGVGALLDDDSLPVIIGVQEPPLFTDGRPVPVREPASQHNSLNLKLY
jgi:hypothetical protein